MSLETLKSAIATINTNLTYMDRSMGEEATKHSLILPILKGLGYEPSNPREVRPEYSADTRELKRGQKEKVDYAIFLEDTPVILLEAKSYSESLRGYEGQLQYYCNALISVRLGILTNGIEWKFFTDTKNSNFLDDEPFFTIDLTKQNDDEKLAVLYTFAKNSFNPSEIQEFGWQLKYTKRLTDFFVDEFDTKDGELSEPFIRWVLKNADCYSGSLTIKAVEQFKPLIKKAFRSVIGQMVSRKYLQVSHLIQESNDRQELDKVTPEEVSAVVEVLTEDPSEKANMREIVTTEDELACFDLVKTMMDETFQNETIYDPASRSKIPIEVAYKDTTGYFGIYINKPSWWLVRINLSAKQKWIGFNKSMPELVPEGLTLAEPNAFSPMRVFIEKPLDLLQLRSAFHEAVRHEISQKESLRIKAGQSPTN